MSNNSFSPVSGLKSPATLPNEAWTSRPWRERWHEVARYGYRDLNGRVLFEHVRWQSRHPSGIDPGTQRGKHFTYRFRNRANQLAIGLPRDLSERDRHLIYRLPELARVARGEWRAHHAWAMTTHPAARRHANLPALPPLVICEGEKDVHALERHGFLATTAHGGAMHGWGIAEWQWLVEIDWPGDVWLAVDDDKAGWYHAMKAIKAWGQLETHDDLSLLPTLQCVRARMGKDPADALAAGLGKEWWDVIGTDAVVALGEAAERRIAGGLGGGHGGQVNGYLTPAAIEKWRDKERRAMTESEDW